MSPAEAGAVHQPTADLELDPAVEQRGLWLRRLCLALLAVVVAAGALGFLGVRSRTVRVRSDDGGVDVAVRYAQVARAGLNVPFQVTVRRRGGFTGEIVVAVSSNYLGLFDRNAIDPEPSSSTATSDMTIWHFDRPPGDTFVVSLDMQVQYAQHWGRSGTVIVSDARGRRLAQAHVKTWISP